jgi:hypothetical protein
MLSEIKRCNTFNINKNVAQKTLKNIDKEFDRYRYFLNIKKFSNLR